MGRSYRKQNTMPFHKGKSRQYGYQHVKQNGEGFGALMKIGRRIAPVLSNVIVPAAKRIAKSLAEEAAPEIMNVIEGKVKPRQALKQTVKRTARKQLGGGGVHKKTTKRRRKSTKTHKRSTQTRKISRKKGSTARSRADILCKLA